MRERLLTALGKQITLEDGRKYHYIIRKVEIENALGAVVAILDEFLVTDEQENSYKLHKTKEGNWYDSDSKNSTVDHAFLQRLKRAIDNQVKEISE